MGKTVKQLEELLRTSVQLGFMDDAEIWQKELEQAAAEQPAPQVPFSQSGLASVRRGL